MLKSIRSAPTALLATALAIAAPCPALAALGGSIDITSDYVLRGVSQSQGKAAWQGDVHWDFPAGFSSGVWASQVALEPHSNTWELDGYLQWHRALSSDLELDAAATYYTYPSDPRPADYNYAEMSLGMMWRDQFRIAASWIPSISLYSYADGLAVDRQVFTLETSWHRDLPAHMDLSAGIGFYYPPGLEYASYAYGDATLGWKYGHWRVNLALIWAQNAAHRQYSTGPNGGPVVGTLAWVF